MKKIRSIISMLLSAAVCLSVMPFTASSDDSVKDITGRVYEFDKKGSYEFEGKTAVGNTANQTTMGKLTIKGALSSGENKDGVNSYIVEDDAIFTINYSYDNSLLKADKMDWHIIDDGDDEVAGVKLDDDIDSGAILLLTSLDHNNWFLNKAYLDISDSSDAGTASQTFKANEIQLTNGCYYRIIVAYKLERQIDNTKVLFIDTSDTEAKKVAEVYEFYAGYKSAEDKTVPSNEKRFTLGETVYAGNDDGFSKNMDIENGNPHYGWDIGSFFVSGYTDKTDDNVFIKTVGDKVSLWFSLKQTNLNKLNGNKDLYVAEDINGFDQYFKTEKTNFKHGALIIRHTNYEGVKSDPIIYTDFLAALSSPGADTKVQLFEEGDYEVALDYQINEKGTIYDSEYDYRIFFTFKIRNGNNMIFPKDAITGAELKTETMTENGFTLDLANSRYLKINVELTQWVKTENGYVEDTRFNRPAKDGDVFTDEGIYTITVTNPATDPFGNNKTTKKIYVGTDNIMKAYINRTDESITVNQIAAMVYDGAVINDDGSITMPEKDDESYEGPNDGSSAVDAAVTSIIEPITSSETTDDVTRESDSNSDLPIIPIAIGGGAAVVLVILIAIIKKAGGKKNEKN